MWILQYTNRMPHVEWSQARELERERSMATKEIKLSSLSLSPRICLVNGKIVYTVSESKVFSFASGVRHKQMIPNNPFIFGHSFTPSRPQLFKALSWMKATTSGRTKLLSHSLDTGSGAALKASVVCQFCGQVMQATKDRPVMRVSRGHQVLKIRGYDRSSRQQQGLSCCSVISIQTSRQRRLIRLVNIQFWTISVVMFSVYDDTIVVVLVFIDIRVAVCCGFCY